MLNRKKLIIASGLAIAALVPELASAHTDVSIGLNFGAPVYVEPVYQPAPRVIYEQPAPVVYETYPSVVYGAPAPVVYGGTVVYGHPHRHGYWEERHREWGEHHRDWDEHRGDRDGDRYWR